MENKRYNIKSFDGSKIVGGSDEYVEITDEIPNMEKLINVTDVNDIHIDKKLNEINRINFDGKEISFKVMDIIDEIELIKKFLVNGLIKKDEFI